MKKADNKKKRLYDLLLIGGVLILAAVLLLVFVLNRRGNSDTADGPCAVVLISLHRRDLQARELRSV